MKNKKEDLNNFMKCYKNIQIRPSWIGEILLTYFDNYEFDNINNYELNLEAWYFNCKIKDKNYKVYFRKELILEKNKEIPMYRIINCIEIGDIIDMQLSLG